MTTTDTKLADELLAAETEGTDEERIVAAQNDVCIRLNLDLDETFAGLTPRASEAIDAFIAEHRTK